MRSVQSGFLRFLSIAALTIATLIVLLPEAQACRDCPFPTPVGKNRWQMPESNAVIGISQSWTGKSYVVTVRLYDSRGGAMLASGSTRRLEHQYTIFVKLLDRTGNHVFAKIHWPRAHESVIQAKLECARRFQCLLNDL